MSHNNSFHKNRWKSASQWIQAVVTLFILLLLYSSRNLFGGDFVSGNSPETPPANYFVQNSYWNEDFGYGFRGENNDKYQNKTLSGIDLVAIDSIEGVIFEDAKVKVSFYKNHSMDEIEKIHNNLLPKAYSELPKGIAVIEGDLNSPTAKTILATLHTR